MAKPRIDINHAELRNLLTGPQMQRLLRKEAEPIAQRAGAGVEVEVRAGRNRARATIRTATTEARIAQIRDDVLRKALGR